jgi:hypothetical protein
MQDLLFEILVSLLLIGAAERRRNACRWDRTTASRRLWFGLAGILVVQIGGFVNLLVNGRGPGIGAIIQWPCIYLVALALFRRSDLKRARAAEDFVKPDPASVR